MLLLFPFYRWGNEGTERFSNLAKVTHLVSGRARVEILGGDLQMFVAFMSEQTG